MQRIAPRRPGIHLVAMMITFAGIGAVSGQLGYFPSHKCVPSAVDCDDNIVPCQFQRLGNDCTYCVWGGGGSTPNGRFCVETIEPNLCYYTPGSEVACGAKYGGTCDDHFGTLPHVTCLGLPIEEPCLVYPCN